MGSAFSQNFILKKNTHFNLQIKNVYYVLIGSIGEEFVTRRGPSPLNVKADPDLGPTLKKILHLHLLSRLEDDLAFFITSDLLSSEQAQKVVEKAIVNFCYVLRVNDVMDDKDPETFTTNRLMESILKWIFFGNFCGCAKKYH
jgi:hypothetical protein